MSAVCIHCNGWDCSRCKPSTPPAPVTDHDTAADLELEALKEQLRRATFRANAFRHTLEDIAWSDLGEGGDARAAINILSQFPKAGE